MLAAIVGTLAQAEDASASAAASSAQAPGAVASATHDAFAAMRDAISKSRAAAQAADTAAVRAVSAAKAANEAAQQADGALKEAAKACAAASAPGAAACPPMNAASSAEQVARAATDAVHQIAGNALPYVGALALAATLAMALVEFLKAVLQLQMRFQRQRVLTWLGIPNMGFFLASTSNSPRLNELLYLAIGSRDHQDVLFGQDLPKMMGQIQQAAKAALDNPDEFNALYTFLTSSDLSKKVAAANLNDGDAARWLAHRSEVHRAAFALPLAVPGAAVTAAAGAVPAPTRQSMPAGLGAPVPAAAQPVTGALSAPSAAQVQLRVANLVQRKLDGFQLRVDYLWKLFCQELSMLASVGICWSALYMADPGLPWQIIALIGFVGGLLAPYVKDLSKQLASIATGK